MELGGATLSKLIFEIKGEFYKGERVYGVKFQKDYILILIFFRLNTLIYITNSIMNQSILNPLFPIWHRHLIY